jgi:monofunctional biosynthetic peptidoglycan transglycosylase
LHREGPRVPNPACCGGSAVSLYGAIGFVIGSIALVALYRILPPPGTPLMLIRLVEGYGIDKSWRPLDEISPHLIHAAMAGEDARPRRR